MSKSSVVLKWTLLVKKHDKLCYNDNFAVEGNKNAPLIYTELHESLLFCLHTVSDAG
jgi:hypothetical protein